MPQELSTSVSLASQFLSYIEICKSLFLLCSPFDKHLLDLYCLIEKCKCFFFHEVINDAAGWDYQANISQEMIQIHILL